ncbi:MAG: hypothetical protein ACRCSG_07075 [Cellulosilyticaceae bacterium]
MIRLLKKNVIKNSVSKSNLIVSILEENVYYLKNTEIDNEIRKMDKRILNIVENYQIIWNKLCKQAMLNGELPKLKKIINVDGIYECLKEIENVKNLFYSKVNNKMKELKLEKLVSENEDGFKKACEKLSNTIMQDVSIAENFRLAIILGIFVYKKHVSLSKNQDNKMNENNNQNDMSTSPTKEINYYRGMLKGLNIIKEKDKVSECMGNILEILQNTVQEEAIELAKTSQMIRENIIWLDKDNVFQVKEEENMIYVITYKNK